MLIYISESVSLSPSIYIHINILIIDWAAVEEGIPSELPRDREGENECDICGRSAPCQRGVLLPTLEEPLKEKELPSLVG